VEIYIEDSKPRRISVYSGLVHIVTSNMFERVWKLLQQAQVIPRNRVIAMENLEQGENAPLPPGDAPAQAEGKRGI
jgi:hypothetical protein